MVDPMFTLIVSVHIIVSVHTRETGKFMMIDSILSKVVLCFAGQVGLS